VNEFWSISLFWILVVVGVAVAMVFVLPVLFRRPGEAAAVDRQSMNIAIARDQLNELEADFKNGLLEAEHYESARLEIEKRLSQDLSGEAAAPAKSGRKAGYAVAATIPVAAIALYAMLGNPQALLAPRSSPMQQQADHGQQGGEHDLAQMMASLEARLKENPDDAQGWIMLGRTYTFFQRFQDAATAFDRATKLMPNEASAWSGLAEAVAITQGRSLRGRPEELLKKALALNPADGKALELAGFAAFEQNKYGEAASFWKELLKQLPPDSNYAHDIANAVREADRLAASGGKALDNLRDFDQGKEAATGLASVSGTVTLSTALAGKASPTDIVFVFARAAQGPKMPLAIQKVQVKDLPFSFKLDDSQAMAPTMKLSNFDQVVVGARVSKSGTAMPQAGDMEGLSQPVKVGSAKLKVVIDTVVR
jgi:cytochrome c-type biogenesis protein CcmH